MVAAGAYFIARWRMRRARREIPKKWLAAGFQIRGFRQVQNRNYFSISEAQFRTMAKGVAFGSFTFVLIKNLRPSALRS